jgi:hypothetical protein
VHDGLQARLTTAVDIYAFGVIAFELLLDLFAGSVNRDYIARLREDPDLAQVRLTTLGCSAGMSDAIVRCLSPDAAARPTAAALVRFLSGDVDTGTLDAAMEAECAPCMGERVVPAVIPPLNHTLPEITCLTPRFESVPAAAAAAVPLPIAAAASALSAVGPPSQPLSYQTGVIGSE